MSRIYTIKGLVTGYIEKEIVANSENEAIDQFNDIDHSVDDIEEFDIESSNLEITETY